MALLEHRISGEGPEGASASGTLENETALSQGPVSYGPEAPPASMRASPAFPSSRGPLEGSSGWAMEAGLGSSVSGLMASPFHSQRIQSEIQLRRARPSTLDADGRRVEQRVEGEVEGEIASVNRGEGPRVARVEAREEEPSKRPFEVPTPRSLQAPSFSDVDLHQGGQAARGATEERGSEPQTP